MKSMKVLAVFFIYTLSIPQISAFFVLLLGFYKLLANSKRLFKYFGVEFLLLAFFLIVYYYVGVFYGYYTVNNFFFNVMLNLSIYIIASTIDLRKIQAETIFLVLFSGLVIYAALSTFTTYFNGDLQEALMAREVNDFWTGRTKNSPTYGAYMSVPLSLGVTVVFLKTHKIEKVIIWSFLLVSVTMLFLFQSRGPFLSGAIIFFLTYWYLHRFQNIKLLNKKRIFLLSMIAIIMISFTDFSKNEVFEAYGERLEKVGAESARYEAWVLGIESLYEYPLGGKEKELKIGNYTAGYVHNMWLDVGYSMGTLPLFLLVLFIAKHLKYLKVLFLQSEEYKCKLYFFIIGLGLLLPTIFEPMMEGSFLYLSLIIFYLSLLKNFYLSYHKLRR